MKLSNKIKDVKRFKNIASTLLIIEGEDILSEKFGINKLKDKTPIEERAIRLRKGFENLGATFIKLGQLLSLRPDLIPSQYCDELRKLQDNAPEFSSDTAKKIVENELGKTTGRLFSSFDKNPIGAASISQVHKATLKNGKKVVIKIKRPNINSKFKSDIDILSYVAKIWEKHSTSNIISPKQIVEEFKQYTENELDYINEARNLENFKRNLGSEKDVIIPNVYWEYSTSNILTMDYIAGKRIDKSLPKSNKERHELMQRIANLEFKQIFEHGIFHADPHPGNIFITRSKKIALLDFGIIGKFDEDLKEMITQLFISMIEKDVKLMTKSMIDLGMADDLEINERELREDLRDGLGKYYNTELNVIKIGELFERLINISKKHKLVLPSNFILFGKSLVTLEGLGEEIDPHFNLVGCAKPYVKNLIIQRSKPKNLNFSALGFIRKIKYFTDILPQKTDELTDDLKKTDKGMNKIHHDIEILTSELDKSSNRMVIGILISGFIVGGALLGNIPQKSVWGIPIFPLTGFILAVILGLSLLRSIKHERKFF